MEVKNSEKIELSLEAYMLSIVLSLLLILIYMIVGIKVLGFAKVVNDDIMNTILLYAHTHHLRTLMLNSS